MSDARQTPGFGTRDSGLGARESSSTTPVDLDAAIDIIAREMTEFEPSGALRARVLERIGQGRRHTLPGVPRWVWAGAAAAAVLAVATAIWVVSPMRDPADTRTAIAEQRPGEASPAATVEARQAAVVEARQAAQTDPAASQTLAATSRVAMVRPPGRGLAGSAQPAGADAGDGLHRVPALAEIEPLAFSAVGPDALEISAVNVPPFPAMPSIDIPSLDAGSNDPQSDDPKKEK